MFNNDLREIILSKNFFSRFSGSWKKKKHEREA